jgi:hypothetical protein
MGQSKPSRSGRIHSRSRAHIENTVTDHLCTPKTVISMTTSSIEKKQKPCLLRTHQSMDKHESSPEHSAWLVSECGGFETSRNGPLTRAQVQGLDYTRSTVPCQGGAAVLMQRVRQAMLPPKMWCICCDACITIRRSTLTGSARPVPSSVTR